MLLHWAYRIPRSWWGSVVETSGLSGTIFHHRYLPTKAPLHLIAYTTTKGLAFFFKGDFIKLETPGLTQWPLFCYVNYNPRNYFNFPIFAKNCFASYYVIYFRVNFMSCWEYVFYSGMFYKSLLDPKYSLTPFFFVVLVYICLYLLSEHSSKYSLWTWLNVHKVL